jgi:hypothetical protein
MIANIAKENIQKIVRTQSTLTVDFYKTCSVNSSDDNEDELSPVLPISEMVSFGLQVLDETIHSPDSALFQKKSYDIIWPVSGVPFSE